MAAKKPLISSTYKGSKMEITTDKAIKKLIIDGKSIPIERDVDTGAYSCEPLPYQYFGTLEELGKAIIDNA